VVSGDDRVAVFRDDRTRAFVRLRPGESHAGWVLRDIGRLEAILENDRETITLALPRRSGGMP